MRVNNQVIEVTGPAVVQIAGCRITIEPTNGSAAGRLIPSARLNVNSPRAWQSAEAELQRRTNMPFEPMSASRAERLEFSPRVGGKYHGVRGNEVEIGKVLGRDRSLWFVLDANGRPAALKRIDFKWHALPPHHLAPIPGDVIVQSGTESVVTHVLGEAEVGGWAVMDERGTSLHVFHGEGSRWFSLGAVEVQH